MRTKKFLSLLLSAAMAFSLLTATAFAAAPAEEENSFFDFLLGKKYTYLYAALTWDEYWANEKVYAAGSTAASAQLDSHEEQDLGAFDAVSRATVNHGLHRGSFQSTAVIYAKDGSSYTVSHWSDDGKTIYLADGTTVGWNRGTITKADGSTVQMDHYEVLGTKYVPVRVATSDLADFCSKYTVVENGGQLVGGYSEKNLTAYTLTAAVDKNTNGLKYATKSGDGYTFSAAHTGTGSGVAEVAQKAAEGLTVNLRSGSDVGSFGEFIRVDLNGNYGELGSRMQSVVWTYYGNDSTYTHAKASYGTKFAADNWMHKSMGIQLGLTDSIRCQLPADTDGTGYWTVTVYALGYADYTEKFEVTEDNLYHAPELMTDEQKTQLTELKDQAKAILDQHTEEEIAADKDLAALKEHYDEAVALLAKADATVGEANELLTELPGLIEAAKPQTLTYTGTATTEPDEDGDFTAYDITATVTVVDGKITGITASGAEGENVPYFNKAKDGTSKYTGVVAQLTGKSAEEVSGMEKIDAVSKATCSSNAIFKAVKAALAQPSKQ